MSDKPAPRRRFLFNVWAVRGAILLCALLLLLWCLGGVAGVGTALFMGIVFGSPMMLLGKKNKLLILCAAILGAVVGTILGLCFLDIDSQILNDPQAKTPYRVKFLFWWVVVGSLLGPILVLGRTYVGLDVNDAENPQGH